jgi:hypothetical protein
MGTNSERAQWRGEGEQGRGRRGREKNSKNCCSLVIEGRPGGAEECPSRLSRCRRRRRGMRRCVGVVCRFLICLVLMSLAARVSRRPSAHLCLFKGQKKKKKKKKSEKTKNNNSTTTKRHTRRTTCSRSQTTMLTHQRRRRRTRRNGTRRHHRRIDATGQRTRDRERRIDAQRVRGERRRRVEVVFFNRRL